MQRLIVAVALVGLNGASASASSHGIEVAPLFWKGQELPAFAVQCYNNSGTSRAKIDYILKSSAFRLDGVLHERQGAVGSFSGAVDVPAGVAFNQLVMFGGSPPAANGLAGEWIMTPWNLSLMPGNHRIAFRCWADWSAEYAFVWAGP